MSSKWKWSFREALSIIRATYVDDWGKAVKDREAFLENPKISKIKDDYITGLMAGSGQPVIFIHGSPANAMRWAGYLENVPDGYQFISIDRMGFGDRGKETPDLEEDYTYISDFVGRFDKSIILGHSLGGAIVTRLLTQHDITGAVLVAASIDPALERLLFVQKIATYPPISNLLSQSVHHSNLEMIQLQEFMEATADNMDQLNAPAYIVHAKDDCLVPYAHVDYAKKYFKNLIITDSEEGGHSIPWHRHDLILDAIASFSTKQEVTA